MYNETSLIYVYVSFSDRHAQIYFSTLSKEEPLFFIFY